jgi:hypothetical protein
MKQKNMKTILRLGVMAIAAIIGSSAAFTATIQSQRVSHVHDMSKLHAILYVAEQFGLPIEFCQLVGNEDEYTRMTADLITEKISTLGKAGELSDALKNTEREQLVRACKKYYEMGIWVNSPQEAYSILYRIVGAQ